MYKYNNLRRHFPPKFNIVDECLPKRPDHEQVVPASHRYLDRPLGLLCFILSNVEGLALDVDESFS